ncbi:hypothetical protein [Algisphaera agarilytica]|uniref:Uncharacterized protein n=1 Tax=Algisphaera agarilytica TaxID=1385975 RepID=A0A7X0LLN7_9BACT|nr:hypothetical protein [Algisphaera agarilytica]MBB6430158.1 hypothetical protein [Algisphaera agarilytica]
MDFNATFIRRSPTDLKDAPDPWIEITHQGVVHTVQMPYQSLDFQFRERLGEVLKLPWLELRIQEGHHWDYSLYLGNQHRHCFSCAPWYWGFSAQEQKSRRGNPKELASLWDMDVTEINRYLHCWPETIDEDDPSTEVSPGVTVQKLDLEQALSPRTKPTDTRAYPGDKFTIGDYDQIFDFMSALGVHPDVGSFQTRNLHLFELPDQLSSTANKQTLAQRFLNLFRRR